MMHQQQASCLMMAQLLLVLLLAMSCGTERTVVVAFVPQSSSTALFPSRWSVSMSAMAEETTAAEDDFYADYDPSVYEKPQRQPQPEYSSSSFDRRGSGGGGGGRGGYGRDRGGSGGGGGGGRLPQASDYRRDTSMDNSNVDEGAVMNLIAQRAAARQSRSFDEADRIRDELLASHGVTVHDRHLAWRSGCSASGSGSQWGPSNTGGRNNGRDGGRGQRDGGRRGGGRPPQDFGPLGHDYQPSADAGPNNSDLNDSEIHKMIADRLQCKLSRNFAQADSLQAQLLAAGVNVHDGLKEWRADGEGFGDGGGDRGGRDFGGRDGGRGTNSRADRNRPYEQAPHSLECADAAAVQDLVDERVQAKSDRDYATADDIREELRTAFNVEVDDRKRMWSVGGFGGFDRGSSSSPSGPYEMAPSPAADAMNAEETDEIQALVQQREEARRERDFAMADEIRDNLMDRNIFIDDKRRQWSVGKPAAASSRGDGDAWTRRGSGTLSEEDEQLIVQMLEERNDCKRNKEFGKADRIRDRLQEEYQVRVDDRTKEWHVVTNDYCMSSNSAPLDDATKTYVEEQVTKRAIAKLQKEYDVADSIRDELRDEYLIHIDDRLKEWTASPETGGHYESSDNNGVEEEGVDDFMDSDDLGYVIEAETDDLDKDNVYAASFDGETEDDLNSLTIPELKEKLRERGLPLSGRKAELIERLS